MASSEINYSTTYFRKARVSQSTAGRVIPESVIGVSQCVWIVTLLECDILLLVCSKAHAVIIIYALEVDICFHQCLRGVN